MGSRSLLLPLFRPTQNATAEKVNGCWARSPIEPIDTQPSRAHLLSRPRPLSRPSLSPSSRICPSSSPQFGALSFAAMSSLPAAAAVRSSQKMMARTILQQQQRRAVSDVTITRTGKPIIRVQGGRYGHSVPMDWENGGCLLCHGHRWLTCLLCF